MGEIKKHPKVKAFAGITFLVEEQLNLVLTRLIDEFGPIDLSSDIFSFDEFTNYYQKEMGSHLQKTFISFENPIPVSFLPQMKLNTNELEKKYLNGSKRSVNIDPGYLTLAKVVLATTKDYIHRLYISDGIYGDLHLFFKDGKYQTQTWTYPDYRQEKVLNFFLQMRSLYLKKIDEKSLK